MQSCRTPAADSARLTLAGVLRAGISGYAKRHRLPTHHWNVLRAILSCRTPVLGGHLYQCRHCRKEHFVPHSCRNRHCPTCQGASGADWMEKQAELVLPIPYFHLVFTLPHELNPLIQQNRAAFYNLLFDTVSATLLEFGRNNLKAQIGVTAVLHTWSQNLLDHYHLHCIVTGGGLRMDGHGWKKTTQHWLFPIRALSKVFRGKFCDGLQYLFAAGGLEFHGNIKPLAHAGQFQQLLKKACCKKWVVYAKRPFAGPDAVLAYLSRYTHRVGLTNARLKTLEEKTQTVTFGYKDYADGSRKKLMTLSLDEFIRRFRLHILPERFVKIRHYGLLANRNRHARIAEARTALKTQPAAPTKPETISDESPVSSLSLPICPHCQQPALVLIRVTHPPKKNKPVVNDSS